MFNNKNRKRKREVYHPDVEEGLFIWFKEKRSQNVMPSGPMLIEKAKSLAAAANIEGMKFSQGWLQNFKERYNIKFKQAHGEKLSADHDSAKDYINDVLPGLLEQYDDGDIYNLDEFGILPKGLSDRGHVLGNEAPAGLKMCKDRITGCVCTNLNGTDKRPLILVGKSKKPRCFPHDQSKLPVHYYSSKNAWMTSTIFEKELQRWNMELKLQNRKILLFVDNSTAHPQMHLSNINQ